MRTYKDEDAEINRKSRFFDEKYVGEMFGSWIVEEVGIRLPSNRDTMWKVRCGCGHVGLRTGTKIVTGKSNMCQDCVLKTARNGAKASAPINKKNKEINAAIRLLIDSGYIVLST